MLLRFLGVAVLLGSSYHEVVGVVELSLNSRADDSGRTMGNFVARKAVVALAPQRLACRRAVPWATCATQRERQEETTLRTYPQKNRSPIIP